MDHPQDARPFHAVEFCAGYAGIHLGLSRAIPNLRLVALCEIEAFACANLVAKMEAGLLDSAPIWTDLKTFPGRSFHGKVDLLVAGYPCQPFSAAGKRMGTEDPRHLWPYVREQIQLMQPRFCFFENVDGHISMGLREVLADLRALGYRVENERGEPTWGVFSAAEVGAPHQRKRVFILARLADAEGEDHRGLPRRAGVFLSRSGLTGSHVAHHLSEREQELGDGQSGGEKLSASGDSGASLWPSRPGERQHCWEPPRVTISNSDGDTAGSDGEHRREFGLQSEDGCDRGTARDSEREEVGDCQVERKVGRGFDEPPHRLDHAQLYQSCDNRVDELRLLGNGVVPATAELAWRTLYAELVNA